MPAAFFTVAFFVLTWPAVTRFHTHYYADAGDGAQNIWNLWWVDRAVTVLHQDAWQTRYLHYPTGTSLLGHTLSPFNGFLAIPFLRVAPLLVVHNGIITFAFVAAGLTAFWLAYDLTGEYRASLLAGFVFTFSSFHFEHAEGHLQLVSLEWIPLFVLVWLRLVARPAIGRGVGAAAILFLVLLCDHYYFFYCVLTALVILAWRCLRADGRATLRSRQSFVAFASFALAAAATSGVLVASLLLLNLHDPLVGAHPPVDYSLDALAPFIYGGHWRFGGLTRAYWLRLSTNYHESSVHVGFAVIALMLYAWLRRTPTEARVLKLFVFLFAFFLVMALGPELQVGGKAILGHHAVLPYALLEKLLPFLSVSGVPIRMMVMVQLCAAVIAAVGFARLWRGSRRDRVWAVVLVAVLLIEYLPSPIPTVQFAIPDYVRVLRDLPTNDAVIDTVSPQTLSLVYQTTHQKPLAFGYLARLPQSVAVADRQLDEIVRTQRFERLWPDFRLRYIVLENRAAGELRERPGATTVWSDGSVDVIDLSRLQRSR